MPSKTSIDHWRTGTELSDQARQRDAIREFTIAIELNPEWPLPYFWRAGEYEDLQMYSQAETDFSRFIELCDSGNAELRAEAHAGRGYVRKRQGNLTGALDDYTQELAINPRSPIGYLDRSLIHNAMGNDVSANADYEAAIKLDSSVVDLANGKPRRRTPPKDAK